MPKQIHFIAAAMFFAAISSQAPTVEAQHLRSRQPLQAGLRWLGQGWSAGYHHRTPGPNTDYYNPYTAHNSMLISKQPGYQSGQNQYYGQPMAPGIPFSVYAPTSGNNVNWDYGHGQSIQPTFVPSDQEDSESDADEASERDTDNDFDPDAESSVTSDPDEPGSIRASDDVEDDDSWDDDEDADFEESSADEAAQFNMGVNATKAGYSRRAPESLESMDFRSFMVN